MCQISLCMETSLALAGHLGTFCAVLLAPSTWTVYTAQSLQIVSYKTMRLEQQCATLFAADLGTRTATLVTGATGLGIVQQPVGVELLCINGRVNPMDQCYSERFLTLE